MSDTTKAAQELQRDWDFCLALGWLRQYRMLKVIWAFCMRNDIDVPPKDHFRVISSLGLLRAPKSENAIFFSAGYFIAEGIPELNRRIFDWFFNGAESQKALGEKISETDLDSRATIKTRKDKTRSPYQKKKAMEGAKFNPRVQQNRANRRSNWNQVKATGKSK